MHANMLTCSCQTRPIPWPICHLAHSFVLTAGRPHLKVACAPPTAGPGGGAMVGRQRSPASTNIADARSSSPMSRPVLAGDSGNGGFATTPTTNFCAACLVLSRPHLGRRAPPARSAAPEVSDVHLDPAVRCLETPRLALVAILLALVAIRAKSQAPRPRKARICC